MNRMICLAIASVVAASAQMASAAVVTALPGGVALTLPAQQFTGGPVTFSGVTYSSSYGSSALGYTGGYSFNGNGSWSAIPMIGLDTATGTFELAFATPISGFLGEVNWTDVDYTGDASMSIYNSSGTLLETLALESGGVNLVGPGFWGFSRGSADISRITFTNEFIGVRSITTIVGGAVPEPASWAMLIAGFGLTGAAMRRRRVVVAA